MTRISEHVLALLLQSHQTSCQIGIGTIGLAEFHYSDGIFSERIFQFPHIASLVAFEALRRRVIPALNGLETGGQLFQPWQAKPPKILSLMTLLSPDTPTCHVGGIRGPSGRKIALWE